MSVDFPAPFWPTRACTSPRETWSSASTSAFTPRKRFVMPVIDSTGEERAAVAPPETEAADGVSAGRSSPRFISTPSVMRRGSIRLCDVRLGVLAVEELVGVDDLDLHRLAGGVGHHRCERLRPEARVAFDGRVEVAGDDCLETVLLTVDRDDLDVLARDLAERLERRDRAERHLVV